MWVASVAHMLPYSRRYISRLEHQNWIELTNDSEGVAVPFDAVSPSNTPVKSYSLGTKVWPIIGTLCYQLDNYSIGVRRYM